MIGTMIMTDRPSSLRSTKSDKRSKAAKTLQRAIRKSEAKERPTVGKPVINDPDRFLSYHPDIVRSHTEYCGSLLMSER